MVGRTHCISALVAFVFVFQLCLHPCNCFSPTKEFFMKHKWDNITNSLTSGATKGFFNDQELTAYLKNLHKNFPDLVPKIETIGKTGENKDIYGLVLTSQTPSNPSAESNEKKPRILFTGINKNPNISNRLISILEGFLHGTDFMSTAALLHLANYLIYGYLHKQPDTTYLLQNREVWIVPAINLDSYAYVSDYVKTHNRTYLITKNRHQNDPTDICGDSAIGVNLNRNFDINFDSLDVIPGAQTKYDPKSAEYICRPYYRGEKPFSEPETAAIRDLLNKYTFELGINLMGIGPKFILPQTYAENINTRLFYESIQTESPFPTGTAFGTRYVMSKEVFNGEMTDYMFQKKNIISASYMIGINEKGYEGYFPTIPKMKRLLKENLDSLLYFIYKAGENLRIEEIWQSGCFTDNTQCDESKDARYYFLLKISNSGLKDFSQNPSILLRFSTEEIYSIEQIFLTTGNNERKQIDFTTITQNGQLIYKIEGPSLKKGESFIITPIIVRTSSASFGRYSEIPSDEPQHLLAYIQDYPNTQISHLKTLIKHPNFDIEEMVAKKLAMKKLIVTSGICVVSTLVIGLGGWIIVKYFKKQPKSQFTKLDDTSQSSRDIEGQIEMTKQSRKNKHKEDFDDVPDRPKRKSKRRSESGLGSSQSRERSPDKPKSKTKQPKESKTREGSKDKKSKKKYSQLNKEDLDDPEIEVHHKKAD